VGESGGAAVTSRGAGIAWWVGFVGHLLVLPWYLASGLLAPLWAVVGLVGVWLVLLAAGAQLRRNRPLWMLLIPVVDVAVWFATIAAGEALGDWTALGLLPGP
jgi:hypothetical protein